MVAVVVIAEQLKQQAQQLGFVLSGITAAATPGRLDAFHAWLDAGYAGQMQYLHEHRQAYSHPRHVLDGCRTILMLAMPYGPAEPYAPATHLHLDQTSPTDADTDAQRVTASAVGRPAAKVARYAQGTVDYHDLIHLRLKQLRQWLIEKQPGALVRGVVDTAPLLEREMAAAAGLGWIGKNTLLLNRRWGSYFFLAALLCDLDLPVDAADEKSYCGTCTACLQACPTNAFPSPFVLDARRCISYLTIEHRGEIEPELQDQLSGWIFGCDVCQQVCPWNRKVPLDHEPEFTPRDDLSQFDLLQLLEIDDQEFRRRFRRTPLWRAKRRGLLRNAILIAGSRQIPEAYESLQRLCTDEDEMLAQAAEWAIAQFTSPPNRPL